MPRRTKKTKPLIYVFCEGESEQAYTDFLKQKFSDVAVIKRPSATGLFEEADSRFKKDPKFRNSAEVTDEIWFFFDVETKDIGNWDKRLKIIKNLRKLRKGPNIKVRLLMTTGCIEYWLMLHYKMFAPPVLSVADKDKMRAEVVAKEPSYVKGDYESTARIAEHYPTAVKNAEKTLHNLLSDGLPGLEDTDERNQWLCTHCKTFSTVNEAITFLEQLHNN
ncbi:MAG: RloB domain-containing protein [Oscillospiraceae bacterium]|nr:RloB domain-containing protein [Oscillospiraceae bacterium]